MQVVREQHTAESRRDSWSPDRPVVTAMFLLEMSIKAKVIRKNRIQLTIIIKWNRMKANCCRRWIEW